MSIEIAYSGIKDKYLNGIRRNLKEKDAVFTHLSNENYQPILCNHNKDALIIGEEINNPIRLAQEAYSFDNSLSILIISEPSHYKKLKQALLFTPFIGSSVNCISDGDDQSVAHMVEELILKTQQRRNYQSLKKIEIPVHTSPKIEALKKEYVNKFFEKAPIGAILLDHDSVVLGLNHHASKVMNAFETDILGSSFNLFFPDNIQTEIKDFFDQGYKDQPKKSFIKSTDPEQHIAIAVTEIVIQNNYLYKIAIVEDITEKVVKDRKIQDQVSELKKINTDLDNFIYTASHDLKAPISNIEGLIYSVKDFFSENPNEEQKHILDMIEKSIVRFKGTIEDLSDIAKIQRNIEEDIGQVDIKTTIEEVVDSLGQEIKLSDAKIKLQLGKCSSLHISKANFKSIIYNLVCNSIKYRSPDRSPIVRISCKVAPDYIVLEVKDNGLGISKKNQSKMFSMFKRFHDHVEGTGIGLYIVKRILDNSGSKIEVESEEDKGTSFKVYLKRR